MNYLQRNAFTSLLFFILIATLALVAGKGPHLLDMKAASFLPLHTFMETFSVMVSMLIFAVGWTLYGVERAKPTLILSCVLLSVGILDFVHLLSYPGMPDFISPSSVQKSIYFWLCARSVLAVAMLASVFINWQSFHHTGTRYIFLVFILFSTLLLSWIGLFYLDSTPVFFIKDIGLTRTKIQIETLLSILYFVAGLLFLVRARQKKIAWMADLSISSFIMALAETYFTLYQSPYDINNLMGHIYKVIAYAYLYKAIFLHSVRYPMEQLKTADEALRRSQKTLQMTQFAVDRAGDYIFMFDAAGKFTYVNSEAAARLGYSRTELLTMSVSDVDMDSVDKNWMHYWGDLLKAGFMRFETKHKTKAGEFYPAEVSLSLIDAHEQTFACAIVRDISERISSQTKINNLAYYDQITQLPNRILIEDRIHQAIANANRNTTKVAVLFLDLDNFKNINDSLGHQAGDHLLRQVGLRLLSRIRASDSVGRYGGDEFIFVLPDLQAPYEVADIANKLLDAVAKPFAWQGAEFRVTTSIGISLYPEDGHNFSQLVMNADAAMYHAKKLGRNNYQFFSSEMNVRATKQLHMENNLRRAIELKQFVLHYQPQIDIKTGECVAFEALIRWFDPDRGLISPLEFIPLAEERGLIVAIGDWVIEEACRQNALWLNAGLPVLPIWVNVSSPQFHRADIVGKLKAALDRHQLDAKYLAVEITESAIMHDAEQFIVRLNELKAMGVSLAIDDFGTGYSSLSYLKRFPLDKIKIDRSFIRDMTDDNEDLILTQAIIALAGQMKLKVIAEGVEMMQQYDLLRKAGCDEFQGYLVSKPVAADEIEHMLGGSCVLLSAALA